MKGLIAVSSLALLSIAALAYSQTDTIHPPSNDAIRDEAVKVADQSVRASYPILLDELALAPDAREALLSWLIQEEADSSTVVIFEKGAEPQRRPGRELTNTERSQQITEIIGPAKLQQFLKLERNLPVYAEAQSILTLLQLNGAPATRNQRDHVVRILFSVDEQLPPPQGSLDSLEGVTNIIDKINERERRFLELASSVLSAAQVQYVSEQYYHRRMSRANSLERQKKRRAEHPEENTSWSYPTF